MENALVWRSLSFNHRVTGGRTSFSLKSFLEQRFVVTLGRYQWVGTFQFILKRMVDECRRRHQSAILKNRPRYCFQHFPVFYSTCFCPIQINKVQPIYTCIFKFFRYLQRMLIVNFLLRIISMR